MFRRVLVPIDFGVCSVEALNHACDLVRAIGGHLTLLHVLEGREEVPGHAEAELRRLGQRGRRPPTLLVEPLEEHSVAEVILGVARRSGAELLVLGPHGGLDPTLPRLGRVATEVLSRTHLTVQLVPAPGRASPALGARWHALTADRAP